MENGIDYYLKFPNQEVRSALKLVLIDFITQKQQEAGRAYSKSILDDLRNNHWTAFLNRMRTACLAKAGYRFLDKTEKSFQGLCILF
ncbi:MAG TPA: hypothetical protein VK133_00395 [Amoebophilaceae bacterium]|nr:hypothetical protein [Amoebophilaceae bacterium]